MIWFLLSFGRTCVKHGQAGLPDCRTTYCKIREIFSLRYNMRDTLNARKVSPSAIIIRAIPLAIPGKMNLSESRVNLVSSDQE